MTHPKSKPYDPKRYSGDKNETARRDNLPTWGAVYLYEGEYFKIGHLGKVFRWGITEWMLSSRTVEQIKKGVFGRFWGGRFQPEAKV